MPDVLVRCAFHSISVVCCSLDRAGTGALAALGIRAFENFSDRFAYLRLEPLRGKKPPGWRPGGGSHEGTG